MIRESSIMEDIHKNREQFYQQTKDKSHSELLKLIKNQSKKMERELARIRPNPELIITEKYVIPEPEAMREIHQIREKRAKYGKR